MGTQTLLPRIDHGTNRPEVVHGQPSLLGEAGEASEAYVSVASRVDLRGRLWPRGSGVSLGYARSTSCRSWISRGLNFALSFARRHRTLGCTALAGRDFACRNISRAVLPLWCLCGAARLGRRRRSKRRDPTRVGPGTGRGFGRVCGQWGRCETWRCRLTRACSGLVRRQMTGSSCGKGKSLRYTQTQWLSLSWQSAPWGFSAWRSLWLLYAPVLPPAQESEALGAGPVKRFQYRAIGHEPAEL